MYRITLITTLLLLLTLTASCQNKNKTTAKQPPRYQGYIDTKTEIFTGSNGTPMMSPFVNKVLLNKEYLIEPIVTENYEEFKYISANTEDTRHKDSSTYKGAGIVGYYFIDLKNKIYLEFDTLSAHAKAIKRDDLKNKSKGLSIYAQDIFQTATDISMKDTAVGKAKFKVATGVSKEAQGNNLISCMISPTPKHFPVQFSPAISKKANDGFTYKVEQLQNGVKIISELHYEQTQLPDSIVKIFNAWASKL